MATEALVTIIFSYLKDGYGVYKTVNSLSLKIAHIIEKSGDSHYKTAIDLLNDMKRSNNPQRDFEQAILSLRTALDFFVSAGDAAEKELLGKPYGKAENYLKAFATAILIADCYNMSRENRLEKGFLKRAKTCFSTFASELVLHSRIEDTNGLNFISMTRMILKGDSSGTAALIEGLEQKRQELNVVLRGADVEELREPIRRADGLMG